MSSVGIYDYRDIVYTGTRFQPDVLTVFIKQEKDDRPRMQYAEPRANVMGKLVPIIGSVMGAARVVNAVKAIFRSAFGKQQVPKGALLNAFKNLVRGIIEFIPCTGLSLLMFDTLRNHLVFSTNIEKQVADQENIAGIAMDGRVICTMDLASLHRATKFQPKSDEHALTHVTRLTLCLLKKWQERDSDAIPMPRLFARLRSAVLDA